MSDCPPAVRHGRKAYSFAAEAKTEVQTEAGAEAAEEACDALERLLEAEQQAREVEARTDGGVRERGSDQNVVPSKALDELREEWEQAARGSTSGRALGLETAADELRVLVEEHKGIAEGDGSEKRTDGGTNGSDRLVRVDYDEYPDEIDCVDCGGTAVYQGANWGSWVCRDCGIHYPVEEAERQLDEKSEPETNDIATTDTHREADR